MSRYCMARSYTYDNGGAFPGIPNRSDIPYPHIYGEYRRYPYPRGRSFRRGLRSNKDTRSLRTADLLDKSLDYTGDLGWTLEYATAWCYRFLVGNQTDVIDVIDNIRTVEEVEERTPYVIFDYLDKAVFGGKLKSMVHLRWKTQASYTCGSTSAPGVASGIPRVAIDLNKLPFEDGDGDIDDLLDALIHQMIHAFFLVCCGAQPSIDRKDGRLEDGLHFGVILYTILDISKQCHDGPLPLIFYAAKRRSLHSSDHLDDYHTSYGYGAAGSRRANRRQTWIALDSQGGTATRAAPADGQTHCTHDNRSIRPAQIRNWQVEHYSRAIDLGMENKGDIIFDLGIDNKFVETNRLKGPPSTTYVELIWENKRIMVPREKTLKFGSIRKPIERHGMMELKVPDCPVTTLRFLYDYLQHKEYYEDPEETMARSTIGTKGPPILIVNHERCGGEGLRMLDHIRVFKMAEAMKFEELTRYALTRLYDMPVTHEDPIEALKELYNDRGEFIRPIHSELHKWARKFLARTDDQNSGHCHARHRGHVDCGDQWRYRDLLSCQQGLGYESFGCYDWPSSYRDRSRYGSDLWYTDNLECGIPLRYGHPLGQGQQSQFFGPSNFEKILRGYPERFRELFQRSTALQDDCELVRGRLNAAEPMQQFQHEIPYGPPRHAAIPELCSRERRPMLPRSRSWSNLLPQESYWSSSLAPQRSWDELALPREIASTRPVELSRQPRLTFTEGRYYPSSRLDIPYDNIDILRREERTSFGVYPF